MSDLRITDEARTQILAALEQQQPARTALRLEATTNGTAEFAYGMRLVGDDDLRTDDVVVESNGVKVLVDPGSARNLEGATIDYEEGVLRSGFRFDNPNKPEIPELGEGPSRGLDWSHRGKGRATHPHGDQQRRGGSRGEGSFCRR